MKKNFIILGSMLLIVPQALLFAEWDWQMSSYQWGQKQGEQTSSMNSSEYWAEKKVQIEQRSTEMRKAKYSELQSKWVDVSTLTSDILDASKIEEWIFWDTLKKIQQAQEIKSRTEFLIKLANQSVDTSQFTDEVIADGQKFWDLVKKLQSTPRPQISDRPNMNPKVETGGLADREYQEISTRKKNVEYLREHGMDVSGFTDSVISDPTAFWKLVDTIKGNAMKQSKNSPMKKDDDMMNREQWSSKMMWGSGMMNRDKMGEKENVSEEKMVKKESPMKSTVRPALTEKARKLLQDKLDKIPSEKRDTILPKMLKTAQSQFETAKTKSNKTLIRKLEAIIEIIQDEIDSEDDSSLIDSLLTE
jgi:hypothetical protein